VPGLGDEHESTVGDLVRHPPGIAVRDEHVVLPGDDEGGALDLIARLRLGTGGEETAELAKHPGASDRELLVFLCGPLQTLRVGVEVGRAAAEQF
jgi:hypothetical protein